MELQKVVNLLDMTSGDKDLPSFVAKKWIEVYDQSRENYNVYKEIRIKTPILRSDLCDFSDAYIVVKGSVTVTDNGEITKIVAFKNSTPFINCISKFNGEQIDNAEDLNVVMPMYNLLEYSKNYRKTNQVILFLLILDPSNTKQELQETLIMLVLVKPVMMQTKLVKMKLKLLFH